MKALDLERAKICYRALDNLNLAVLLFDERKRLFYINPAAEMLFAVSARRVVGVATVDLPQCPSEMLDKLVSRALHASRSFTERELRLPISGGRTFLADCTATPLEEPGVGREVLVELRQVGRHLRISREEQLIAQHQATRALVRGLAHEIKNPLGGLRGAAQLLERELPEPSLKEYTRIIIEEADRLQNLVDRMLGPRRPPRKRLVNVHRLVERVYGLVEAELAPARAGEGIEIIRDYDPSIPRFMADPDQLIQAILNIVRNALQILNGKGRIILRTRVERQYTIASKRHKLAVRIEVIDNGPGVSHKVRETLFFPMITGRANGTGLGLSIAQSLINQHGGLIECASQPGNTVFTVLIPLEMAEDEQQGTGMGDRR